MTAPGFDPTLVEQAARVLMDDMCCPACAVDDRTRWVVRAVLTAVAPTLRAEGAPWSRCTGASDCPEEWHVHGCYSDDCQCSDPNDHDGWDAGYRRGKVDGARQVVEAVEKVYANPKAVQFFGSEPVAAAREAVVRIEGGAA